MTYPVLDVALRAAEPLVQRLGWTLVHSLWQGVLVAAVLAVVLRLLLRGDRDRGAGCDQRGGQAETEACVRHKGSVG